MAALRTDEFGPQIRSSARHWSRGSPHGATPTIDAALAAVPGCRHPRDVVTVAQKAVEFAYFGRLHSVVIDLGCRGMEGEVGGNSYGSRRHGAGRSVTGGSGTPRVEVSGARASVSPDTGMGRVSHT